jgi:hypothetical protein
MASTSLGMGPDASTLLPDITPQQSTTIPNLVSSLEEKKVIKVVFEKIVFELLLP